MKYIVSKIVLLITLFSFNITLTHAQIPMHTAISIAKGIRATTNRAYKFKVHYKDSSIERINSKFYQGDDKNLFVINKNRMKIIPSQTLYLEFDDSTSYIKNKFGYPYKRLWLFPYKKGKLTLCSSEPSTKEQNTLYLLTEEGKIYKHTSANFIRIISSNKRAKRVHDAGVAAATVWGILLGGGLFTALMTEGSDNKSLERISITLSLSSIPFLIYCAAVGNRPLEIYNKDEKKNKSN